jgi:hypothetical protein
VACKHSDPPPPPGGVNIQAPGVRINVPAQYEAYKPGAEPSPGVNVQAPGVRVNVPPQ